MPLSLSRKPKSHQFVKVGVKRIDLKALEKRKLGPGAMALLNRFNIKPVGVQGQKLYSFGPATMAKLKKHGYAGPSRFILLQ